METNKFYRIALVAGAMAAAVSCSKKSYEPISINSRVAVKFCSGISQLQSRVSGTLGTNWDANDPIGIYMIGASGALTTANLLEEGDNLQYKAASAGTDVDFNAVGNSLFYPASGDVKFVAYYPYSASVGSDFKLPISVAAQTSQSAIDVLYAPAGTSYSKQSVGSTAVALPFVHKLVKLAFTISAGDGVDAASLSGLVLKIGGQQSAGTLDLATGTVTATVGTPTQITALTAANGLSSEAIVLPGSTSVVSLTFTASGVTYTGSITSGATSWDGGYRYPYNITLNSSGVDVDVVGGTISPWNDADFTSLSYSE